MFNMLKLQQSNYYIAKYLVKSHRYFNSLTYAGEQYFPKILHNQF